MTISFNHTIVASRDKREAAQFLAELFGLPSPKPFGHFMVVELAHGASLDYADTPDGEEIRRQHYAFLVSEDDFDAIYGKITSRNLEHWADPGPTGPVRSTTATAGVACTSSILRGTPWRSSRAPTALAADARAAVRRTAHSSMFVASTSCRTTRTLPCGRQAAYPWYLPYSSHAVAWSSAGTSMM